MASDTLTILGCQVEAKAGTAKASCINDLSAILIRPTAQAAASVGGVFFQARLGPNPFLQLCKLAGAIGGAVRRDDFNVQAPVQQQFRRLFHRGGRGIPAQCDDSRRIERGNEKLHGRLRPGWSCILTRKAASSSVDPVRRCILMRSLLTPGTRTLGSPMR